MGLHSASDRRGNPNEEEKEEHCYTEASGQSSPHTAEEPIKRLSAGQDFQLQQIRVTADWLLDQTFVPTLMRWSLCDVRGFLLPHRDSTRPLRRFPLWIRLSELFRTLFVIPPC